MKFSSSHINLIGCVILVPGCFLLSPSLGGTLFHIMLTIAVVLTAILTTVNLRHAVAKVGDNEGSPTDKEPFFNMVRRKVTKKRDSNELYPAEDDFIKLSEVGSLLKKPSKEEEAMFFAVLAREVSTHDGGFSYEIKHVLGYINYTLGALLRSLLLEFLVTWDFGAVAFFIGAPLMTKPPPKTVQLTAVTSTVI